ncbi:MAG: MBL fold metallo-hydrolase [Christensenella sp.]|nr:MBL fold metallo-hydrolase [Christensenella sp.]
MGLRFKILYLGATVGSKNDLVKENDPEVMIKSPHWALLVEHPVLGKVLVDTGDSDDWKECYSEHIQNTYPMTEFIPLGERLKENGISYEDIDVLIITHFHFDHVGGLKYFSNTKAGKNIYV